MRHLFRGIVLTGFVLAAGCGNNTTTNKMDLAMAGDLATKPVDMAGPPADMTPLFPVPAGCVTGAAVTGTAAYAVIASGGCSAAGCHMTGQNPVFTTMATFMTATRNVTGPIGSPNFKYVLPGDPNKSYLLYKLGNLQGSVPGGSGSQMPSGGPFFTAVQMCTIYNWILNNAPTT